MGLKHSTRDKIKELNIPEKPKKPLGPYMKFFGEKLSVIKQNNPELKLTEIAKKCAEDWKAFDPDRKQKLHEEYKLELEAYSKRFLEFQSKLTNEQKIALEELSKEKADDKQKRKVRQVISTFFLGMVYLNHSTYFFFS